MPAIRSCCNTVTDNSPAKRSLWDRTWRDPQGRLVLGQQPNWIIIAWAVVWLSIRLWPGGNEPVALRLLSSGLLLGWASLELLYGVNYFRRFLGLTVIVFQIIGLVAIVAAI